MISKDIGRKDVDLCLFFLPCMGGKACLLAGMLEKGLAVPSVLCRNLGQKKTGVPSFLDVDSMLPHLNLVHIFDLLEEGSKRISRSPTPEVPSPLRD